MTASLQEQARALGHPTRHRIFRYVLDAARAVDVAELTGHVGCNHNAVRQHLAKLVAAGLLVERTASSGRPGRPRLVYEAERSIAGRWGVSSPYERLSMLLAEVIRTGDTPVEVGRRAGRDQPVSSSSRPGTTAGLVEAMARQGFDPDVEHRGDHVDIVLRACPFQSTALAHPETVCSLHLGIARGLAEHVPDVSVTALVARDPRVEPCILHLHVGGPAEADAAPRPARPGGGAPS